MFKRISDKLGLEMRPSQLYFSFGRGMPVLLSQDGKVSLAGQSGEAPVDHILNSINVVISAN